MYHFIFSWHCERTYRTGTVTVPMAERDAPIVDIHDDAEDKAWDLVKAKLGHDDFEVISEDFKLV